MLKELLINKFTVLGLIILSLGVLGSYLNLKQEEEILALSSQIFALETELKYKTQKIEHLERSIRRIEHTLETRPNE